MKLRTLLAGGALGVGLMISAPSDIIRADGTSVDPRIQKLVASVSEERLAALLKGLASFETRNTLSSADSPRGIGAARQWILDELKKIPRLQVSFDTHRIAPQGRITRQVELRNVMAVLPGRSARRVYISGHYDSVARQGSQQSANDISDDERAARAARGGAPFDVAQGRPAAPVNNDGPAPGVNDDGSGTALTMELARVFGESGLEFDATLVFICLAGEEQGLVGARAHAQKAAADKVPIDAVFNNDIIGNPVGGNGIVDAESLRVFSEGPEDSPSRQIARYLKRYGARYLPSHRVVLLARHDRFGRGGDHSAFNQSGFAAVRITESNENYSRQHSTNDTLAGVSPAYLARNTMVNGAAAASLALAPAAPAVIKQNRPMIGRQPSGYDANLRWKASSGAAGYRVFWRQAWTLDWEHEIDVGNVTQVVLQNVSIDDCVFGVAAVDAAGHESLVSVYVNPPRAATPTESTTSDAREHP